MHIRIAAGSPVPCSYCEIQRANLAGYCKRWGYELVYTAPQTAGAPPPYYRGWWRVPFTRDHLAGCDWLLSLEPDCLVMNYARPLTELITACRDDQNFVVGDYADTLPGWVATGAMFVRNTPAAAQALQGWLERSNLHHPMWDSIPPTNLPNECFAFCAWLGHDPTLDRQVNRVSRAQLNIMWQEYKPGDFLLHLCGEVPSTKHDFMVRFASQVRL